MYALNTGCNCLESILRLRRYDLVYLPLYNCDVLLKRIQSMGIQVVLYHINYNLEICEQIEVNEKECVLYVNYFGLKDNYIKQLVSVYGNHLIIDNSQAFYSKPINNIDSFNSCRKFFGVPDGAYLFTNTAESIQLERDASYARMSFLLKRIDLGAEAGYADFREQSELLEIQPIRRMSRLTERIMSSIDYDGIAKQRRNNYCLLDKYLSSSNGFHFALTDDAVPMVYPYLPATPHLKNTLLSNKVFVATYWPNVIEQSKEEELEYSIAKNACFLPVDQRYGASEMRRIVDLIMEQSYGKNRTL